MSTTAVTWNSLPTSCPLIDVEVQEREANGRAGVRDGAASRLGLKRTTFITRMKKFGIDGTVVSVPEEARRSVDASDTADSAPVLSSPIEATAAK